jgi:hypothetical protein
MSACGGKSIFFEINRNKNPPLTEIETRKSPVTFLMINYDNSNKI